MIFRVLLFLMFGGILTAQNNLIIFSANGEAFSLKMAEKKSTGFYGVEFKIDSLYDDTVTVEISMQNSNLQLKSKIFLMEKGKPVKNKEFTYSLENDIKKNKLFLRFISAYPVKKMPNPLLPEKPKEDTSYKWKNNVYGTLFEIKDGKVKFFNNIPENGNCKTNMPQENIEYAVKLIARSQTQDDKYDYARETVKNNCYSCAQLNTIINTLSFELDKLKLCREAYGHLTDKENIKQLEPSFKFESSKKELKSILSEQGEVIKFNRMNCSKPINDSLLRHMVSEIKLFQNDFDKYNYFKQKGAGECYSVNQFKSILACFIHDREKLDLIKQHYNNITDKENLKNLQDIFSYSESNSSLLEFLKHPY